MNDLQNVREKQHIPLYISITGHRDIRDEDKNLLKKIIKDFIKDKQSQCPYTPLVLLTPLAEGADRIAAEAASESGIDFIGTLPMPIEEYKKNFDAHGSVEEFNSLLSKASGIIEIPLLEGVSIEEFHNNQKLRNEQYYQTGLFNARYCYYLIALWDGTDNNKKGGTADVVKIKQSGIPGNLSSSSSRLQDLQTGPIYHIVTPRVSNSLPENSFEARFIYPEHYGVDEVRKKKHDDELVKNIDAFNKDFSNYSQTLSGRIQKSAEELLKSDLDFNDSPVLQDIACKHGIATGLAAFFQTRRFRALRVLLFLIVIAFLFLQIYGEFYHKPFMLLLYPITMGIGAIWFYIARRRKYEHKHEDYRALAEALRVRFYLNVGGFNENVSDHYLKRHRGELEWVLYALRSSELEGWLAINSSPVIRKTDQTKILRTLKECWIDSQLRWFIKTAYKKQRASKRWESLANGFFVGAILSAVLLFLIRLPEGKLPENLVHYTEALHPILASCMHFFLVLAASFQLYNEKMAFSEQTKNYQLMAQLFTLAGEKITSAIETNDFSEAREIIREAALEALAENGDWLMLHRSRPMELPKG